jgi:hypothetical protein
MAIPEAAIAPARPCFRELEGFQDFFLSLSLSLSLPFFWSVLAAEDMERVSESRGVGACKVRWPFARSALCNTGADWGMACMMKPSILPMLLGDSTIGDMVTTAVAGIVGISGVSIDSVYEGPVGGGTIIGAGILRDLADDLRRMFWGWESERLDDDFWSFCFRFAKPEFGVEGRERDEEGLSVSGLGVVLAEVGFEGADMVLRRGETVKEVAGISEPECRSDGVRRSSSELNGEKLDLRGNGDGGTTVTLGRVLLVSTVFTLALLALGMLFMLIFTGGADGTAGEVGREDSEARCTGLGVDGLRWWE